MTRLTLGCLLLSVLGRAGCVYLLLNDDETAYPFIGDPGNHMPYDWGSARQAQLAGSSVALRISDRGVRWISSRHRLRPALRGWTRLSCTAQGEAALCQTPGTEAVFFPRRAGAAIVPDHASAIAPVLRPVLAHRNCHRHGGRLVSGSASTYAVTLCDVTQKHTDVVFNQTHVWIRARHDSAPAYAVLCVAIVVVVTSVAQNIAHLLGDTSEEPSLFSGLAAALSLFVTVLVEQRSLHAFVTEEDILFHAACTAYVAFYLALWALKWAVLEHTQLDLPVNVLIGSVLIALSLVFDGIENSYLLPVLFLSVTRSMYKCFSVFAANSPDDPLLLEAAAAETAPAETTATTGTTAETTAPNKTAPRVHEFLFFHDTATAHPDLGHGALLHVLIEALMRLSVVLDFALVGLAHQLGFRPLFANPVQGDLYFLVMVAVAFTAARAAWRRTLALILQDRDAAASPGA